MVYGKPAGGKLITPPVLAAALIALGSLFLLAVRYVYGVGAVSDLTDFQAWGVWKVMGVLIGAALVNGGFVTALLVYILNKGQYHRFVGQALLFSFLGYVFAGGALAYDTGRYWGLLNFFIPKYFQPNSVLFEVGLCITAYMMIMGIELAPIILKKFTPEEDGQENWATRITQLLQKVLFLVVGLGVLLPTMHQSGLGGLALIMGDKINPLWQTPFISLFYVISSVAMGIAVVIAVECTLAHRATFKNKEYIELLTSLAKIWRNIAVVLVVFRWVEIIRVGGLARAFEFRFETAFFWLEMGLVLFSAFLMTKPRNLTSPRMLFIAAVLLLSGGSLYRLNTYIIGFPRHPTIPIFRRWRNLLSPSACFASNC